MNLTPTELEDIGYKIGIWPASLMLASIKAMETALANLEAGAQKPEQLSTFPELCDIVGFNDYYENEKRYAAE